MTDNPGTKYNPFCVIIGEPKIHESVWIGYFTLIDGSGGLTIERGVEISSGVQILTHSSDLRCIRERRIVDGKVNRDEIERAPVKIGKYTFIGTNAVILKGVTIGDHCIIGAGAVVTKDVKPSSIVVGVPARVIGTTVERFIPDDGLYKKRKLIQSNSLLTSIGANYK